MSDQGSGATYIPAGNSPNLGVSHHLEVIGTGATYISGGNSTNLDVSHHLEMIETGTVYIPAGLAPVLPILIPRL